jgi:hypothetical protein
MDNKTFTGVTAFIGKAGLTGISGAATTHSSSAGVFSLRGKAITHAADSGVATPTTDTNTGAAITLSANQARVVVFGLTAADAVGIVAGEVVSLDAAGSFLDAPEFPSVPDTLCPFGYVIAKGGATLAATFTVGTSNWNTTGMTYVVTDTFGLPDRPQTAA